MSTRQIKIAILTQPLGHNYGGLLQAFALQRLLESLGYQVQTLNRVAKPSLRLRVKIALQHALSYLQGKAKYLSNARSHRELNRNLEQFRDAFIKLSPPIKSSKELHDYIVVNGFDAVVVGSDQVWRPRYSPKLEDFFLGFARDIENLTKISYAASFGVSDFAVTRSQKLHYANLLHEFHAVSVREASAIRLCERELNYHQAKLIPDPTLYFGRAFYSDIAKRSKQPKQGRYLLSYLLDETKERRQLVDALAQRCGLLASELMPKSVTRFGRNMQPLMPIEEWLARFENADYVITDSFHGCVFSLIFNKKFVAIGNAARGLDRFESLLSQFCLKERLICDGSVMDYDSIYSTLKDEIDWEEIELIRAHQNEAATDFIVKNFPKLPNHDQINQKSSGSGDD